VDIPSFLVKPGMVVEVNQKLENNPGVQEALQRARLGHVPTWLELDAVASRGKVVSLPSRGEIDTAVDEKVIVEFYSRMGG
jgi:small subunit ribosomal protein S4